jgi:hypothetical protein
MSAAPPANFNAEEADNLEDVSLSYIHYTHLILLIANMRAD